MPNRGTTKTRIQTRGQSLGGKDVRAAGGSGAVLPDGGRDPKLSVGGKVSGREASALSCHFRETRQRICLSAVIAHSGAWVAQSFGAFAV